MMPSHWPEAVLSLQASFLILDKEPVEHPSKNSGAYSTALWSSVCLHLIIEWETHCTGINAGNQETSSIPGLPLTSYVTSDKLFCSF